MDFIDLKSQYRRIKPSVDARIARVLEHGQYVMGPEVAELELVLARYCGTKHCVAVASGTDAGNNGTNWTEKYNSDNSKCPSH